MESLGQIVPSISHICINFRTVDNEPQVLEKISTTPQVFQYEVNSDKILKHEFILENGIPFIFLETNLCERPIKLFVDTGAAVSIIANDVIENEVIRENYILNLFGIAGKEFPIKTEGMVHGIIDFNNTFLGSTFHLVDRKYIGTADGYLGFDFLAPYKVNIDLGQICLQINLDNIMQRELQSEKSSLNKEEEIEQNLTVEKENSLKSSAEEKEETEEFFLNILIQNYDFEPINSLINVQNSKTEKNHEEKINLKELNNSNQNNDELSNEPKNGHSNEEIEENFLNIIGQYNDFELKRPKRLKKNQRKFFKKINKIDPNQDTLFKEFDQKMSQKNELNTCQVKCPTNSITKNENTIKNCYAKIKSNNEIFPVINTEKYQYIIFSGKTPQKRTENCGASTLMKKYCSKEENKIKTPQLNEIYKNLNLNTSNNHYFKDYG